MALYAIYQNKKVRPNEAPVGYCSDCREILTKVQGSINIHHWRHKGLSICESKPETEWHLKMKSLFPREYVEVKKGNKRADVLLPYGTAIEFQNSPISAETIKARNANYDRVIWVFNLEKQYINKQIKVIDSEYIEYRRPKKIFYFCDDLIFYLSDKQMYYVDRLKDSYEHNNKTGYNEMVLTCDANVIDLEYFAKDMIEEDLKYKPKPVLKQFQLFQ